MIDINELYIVNYAHESCTPLQNIMRLPQEEAFRTARQLAEKNSMTTAFYRFADFHNYYPKRLETDRILYEKFKTLGGRPLCLHPLSFVLGGSKYLHGWFDKGKITRIPLAPIPSEYISFTFGDSMSTLEKKKELHMVTKDCLLDKICRFEGSLDEYLDRIDKDCRYIEVQLWNDDYCRLAVVGEDSVIR